MTTPTGDHRTSPPLTWRAVAGLLREIADGASLEDLPTRHSGLTADDLRAAFARLADRLDDEAPEEAPTLAAPPAVYETPTLAPTDLDALPLVTPVGEPGSPRRAAAVPGYEVLGELGRGGMGVVYKARHLRLNRVVALKMILAGDHASPELFARFEREAEVVAALQHPHVVQIYEVGEHQGHPFLALEFVPGGSLAAKLTDEPWPAEDAAVLVEKLARAVHVAHQAGIVHRDLKPENVLLTDQGAPKLTDFGLAKRLDDPTGRTRTGELMGTPAYMAPEQAAGRKDVRRPADIHALGAILYRLLTGRPPFEGRTTLDVLMEVLEHEPPPPSHFNPLVPSDLDLIVSRCLEKDPARRYPSAAWLAEDLRRFLRGEPIRARRPSWFRRTLRSFDQSPARVVLWVAVSVGLFLVALSTIAFGNGLGLAACLAGAMLTRTFLRARPAHLGYGAVGGVAVALCLALLIAAGGDAVDRPLKSLCGFGSDPGWSWSRWYPFLVGPGLVAVVLFISAATGAFFAERWLALALGALALCALALLAYPYGLFVPLLGAVAAYYWGGLARLTCHKFSGTLSDVLLSALMGGLLAGILCVGVGLIPGSILGAWIGAVYSRKTAGPQPGEA